MNKNGNISNSKINQASEFPPYSRKKKNIKPHYLTEASYEQIQKILRKDYFNRLENISKSKQTNYIYDDDIKEINKNIEEFERPTKYAAKQVILSNRIRKDNYNKLKKKPKNSSYNSSLRNLSSPIMINNNNEDYRTLLDENKNRKSPLPVIKKVFKDNSPLYYDLNYIDEVENKYIKPFLSNNNIKYRDYIENKKSKAPFNFIIG